MKICGLRAAAEVDAAVEAGADAVGFVFARSKRQVSAEEARPLLARVPPFVARVGVFRWPGAMQLRRVLEQVELDAVQLYPPAGAALPEFRASSGGGLRCLPAFCDSSDLPGRVDATAPEGLVLLDGGSPGEGEVADWARIARIAARRRVVLAGGLDPENLADALRAVRPWGVDVSSGVESAPGVKDLGRIRAFVQAASTHKSEETP